MLFHPSFYPLIWAITSLVNLPLNEVNKIKIISIHAKP